MDTNYNVGCKKFEDLSVHELYSILQLRAAVFVVEQNCVYQDLDDKDFSAYHLMYWDDEKLIAYTRLIPAGSSFQEMSIGRVIVADSYRSKKIGKKLMLQSVQLCYQYFGKADIRIGAQYYLLDFYQSLGFQTSGAIYLEDGIPHIEMVLHLSD